MVAIHDRDAAQALLGRQRDRRLGRQVCGDLPPAEGAVDLRGRAVLGDHLRASVGNNHSAPHGVDIPRQAQHAVGVVPAQVGFDQRVADHQGAGARRAGGLDNRLRHTA